MRDRRESNTIICSGILLHAIIHTHMWSYMFVRDHPWSYRTICDHAWPCMIICHHIWLYMMRRDHILSYTMIWSICSYLFIYDQTRTYVITYDQIYDYIWSYMTLLANVDLWTCMLIQIYICIHTWSWMSIHDQTCSRLFWFLLLCGGDTHTDDVCIAIVAKPYALYLFAGLPRTAKDASHAIVW